MDLFGFYGTVTTLLEGRDYRLRPTVLLIREWFESGEISNLVWVAGSKNLADSLPSITNRLVFYSTRLWSRVLWFLLAFLGPILLPTLHRLVIYAKRGM